MALREGWWVRISPDLQLTLRKPGLPPIHTGTRAHWQWRSERVSGACLP
ncbi:hypothetical protein C4J93_2141 [Pseudomonas sp. R2-37-08W]|nr:hypothetical protein C4J93_2141 [Pseudomonas sp. R2-37-08W]AZF15566.1 hypothetical protein C4J92_2082 [Pseudomonas sp. R3-18-08]AZF31577.1 hypothetical protein C4J89_2102 [Pseudomonas sp. R4-35-07]AZF36852.1 hypothetical protein C4J88_2069 [Pseudomonas sp. R4-39-08]AZF52519.1 hypothetical protein C4J85_2034 [Pseudomonas sp. R4-34-07]